MLLLPSLYTQTISRRALQIIQATAPKKTARAVNCLIPTWQEGLVGIEIPNEVSYLFDLDKGVGIKKMVSVEGKTIPFRDPDGNISFRTVKPGTVGSIKIVNRAASDGRIYDGKPLWIKKAQPGLNFIENAIERSISEWSRSLNGRDVINMFRQTSVRDDISTLFGEVI